MSGLFTIPISGLKEGHHAFQFEINDKFFDHFEESEIKKGDLTAVVSVEKSSTHMDLSISVSGKATISCDRCLGSFDYPVESAHRLLVKFGSNPEDEDPDIIIVPRDEHELDLKQILYEYIHLALPIQRIHPDDSNGNSTCDPQMLEKLKEHLVVRETENDPRWAELKKLMTDN